MDAITLLKQDHRTVEDLFRRFEAAGERAKKTKRDVVDRIVRELSVHAEIEETVLYPAVKGSSDELRQHVLESLEEHHVVKWLLDELDGMAPDHERFDAKVTVLIENVRHHVKDEEREFFPEVRKAFGRAELDELGEMLEQAKKVAPTRPHPKSPDEPPGNVVSGVVSSFIDKVRDTAREATRTGGRSTNRSKPPARR